MTAMTYAPSFFGIDSAHRPVSVDGAERSRHMYVIGASGTGKSYFLQNLIQQDISSGRGLVVIDPHGELYENIVYFCAKRPMLAKKVVLFNPSEQQEYVLGFNPLARSDYMPDISVQTEKFIDAVKRVMHQDAEVQPQLESTLRNAIIPIIENGYSMLELESFFDYADSSRLLAIAGRSEHSPVRLFWRNFAGMQAREKIATVGSTQRRTEKFLFTEAVRLSVGQLTRTLDIPDIVENGKVLVVNLGLQRNRLASETAHLLGIMLVNAFMDYGRSRDIKRARKRPFFLYLDECQHFITSDIAELLTGGRKFGMHLVLANQELAQIADEAVRDAVLAARIQVVFGGISPESADMMERVIGTHHDLSEVKYEHERMTYRPVLRKETVHGRSWSNSEGTDTGSTTSRNESTSRRMGDFTEQPTVGDGTTTGQTSRQSRQEGRSGSISETWVTDHVPEIEHTPTFWTLEEHRYRFWSALRRQPPRYAVIQIGREADPVQFRTADVERVAVRPERLTAFVREVQLSHSCYVPAEIASRRIEERTIVIPPTWPGRARGDRRRIGSPSHPNQAEPGKPVPRDEADPFATDE